MRYSFGLLGFLATLVVSYPATSVDIEIHVDVEDIINQHYSKFNSHVQSEEPKELPKVYLSYETHQALPDAKPNQTYYKFANIPYAHQPIGDRRFKAAEPITDYLWDPPQNNGTENVVCPQGVVGWFNIAAEFSKNLFDPNEGALDEKWKKEIKTSDYPPVPPLEKYGPSNESCLVLDVYVPKVVFDDTDGAFAPGVIVLFHGGGFVFGSKDIFGSPEGLLEQAAKFGKEKHIVFVTVNYRLGAFGWLAGDKFSEDGGLENAGLTDQLVALQWVQDNIRVFGGFPEQVTVLGESAGASSIMHLIASYGGGKFDRSGRREPPAFGRAIMQSPAFFPNVDRGSINATYQEFLDLAKAENFSALQNANSEDLMKANLEYNWKSPYGRFRFGPVVSEGIGSMIPVPLPLLYKFGFTWAPYVESIIVANNRREGSLFTPPWIRTTAALKTYVQEVYPQMKKAELDQVMGNYSIPWSLNQRYLFLKAAEVFGDLGVDCNVWTLRKHFGGDKTYEYFYQIYPGFHGQDVGATFWDHAGEDLTDLNVQVQSERLQRYLTSYAKHNNPNTDKDSDDKEFPLVGTGDKKSYFYIGDGLPKLPPFKDIFYHVDKDDPLPKKKCELWDEMPYWPEPEAAENRLREMLLNEGLWQQEL